MPTRRYGDPGLMPTGFSYGDSQGEGAELNRPLEGIVTKDLIGETLGESTRTRT